MVNRLVCFESRGGVYVKGMLEQGSRLPVGDGVHTEVKLGCIVRVA